MHGMRRLFPALLATFLLLTMLIPMRAAAAERAVIIGFRLPPGRAELDLLRGLGAKVRRPLAMIRATAALVPEEAMAKLKAQPQVAYVEPDAPTALAEPLSTSSEQTESWGVGRVGALALHAQGNFGQGVKIAVLDTGIDPTHPELTNCYRGGINLVTPELPAPLDDSWNGHGTHVAGILAAAGNGSGVVGVAPAAGLYAVKVVDGSGYGTVSDLVAGLEWVAANRMDIANISLGTSSPSLALEAACRATSQAGTLLVAAAGNTGNTGGAVLYPAAYGEVLAVSATARDDSVIWISATGPQIELAAPGADIRSTVPGGGYAVLTGTSQAAPHVAGVAALLLAAGLADLDGNGIADNRDLRLQLQRTAIDLGDPGVDARFGFGLVSTGAAQQIGLRLARLKGSLAESCHTVGLPVGNYRIDIGNDSLSRIQVLVSDSTGDRHDLSRTVAFQPKAPDVASLALTMDADGSQVTFVPEGPVEGFADIIIRPDGI